MRGRFLGAVREWQECLCIISPADGEP